MPVFISLLRGINVGGHRKIRMVDLRAMFESLGYTQVTTYLQSGNVVFHSSRRSAGRIATLLETAIKASFGHDVTVLMRTPAQLRQIVNDNPYAAIAKSNPTLVSVTFLSGRPAASGVRQLKLVDPGPDEFTIGREEIFLHCPNGCSRSRLTPTMLERQLNLQTTTRNWRTVMALHDLVIQRP